MESPERHTMKDLKLFRAVYRSNDLKDYSLDLYASSLSEATMHASELIPKDSKLKHVFHNPDW